MPEIDSSVIQTFDYDLSSRSLTIVFKSGRVYQYYGVPQPVYAGLTSSESKGKYFNACIRGVYAYRAL